MQDISSGIIGLFVSDLFGVLDSWKTLVPPFVNSYSILFVTSWEIQIMLLWACVKFKNMFQNKSIIESFHIFNKWSIYRHEHCRNIFAHVYSYKK